MRAATLISWALLALSAPAAASEGAPTVIIDPGHGGSQAGARGPGGVWEKNLALAIAKRFAQKLRAELKAQAVLTRRGDQHVYLQQRTEFANQRRADLFVSIHLNSMPTARGRRTANGIETYFLSADASGENAARVAAAENAENEGRGGKRGDDLSTILDDLTLTAAHADSSRLAYAVHGALVKGLGAADRGVQQAPFVVLMGAQMPAILVEVGFISNPVEGRRLVTPAYQDQVAEALVAGVKAFLREGRRDVAAAPAAGPEAIKARASGD